MPGETFQTLKSKATQQAKKSGMSQSAAENYGSAMASQAAVKGGAVNPEEKTYDPEFIGSEGGSGIFREITPIINQGSNQNVQQQIAERKAAEILQGQPSGAGLDTLNKYMTKIGTNLQFPSLPFSPLGIITNTIQGLDAKKNPAYKFKK
jgi:hypothetical protein